MALVGYTQDLGDPEARLTIKDERSYGVPSPYPYSAQWGQAPGRVHNHAPGSATNRSALFPLGFVGRTPRFWTCESSLA